MRLLIVDDHILFREGLVSLLRNEPEFEIVGQADCVAQAVQLADFTDPDVILMDFSLPDGTGLDASQKILSNHPDASIIFLTIHDEDERLIKALQSGAKGYLLKNISATNLISSIKALQRGEAAISRQMMARVLDAFVQRTGVQTDEAKTIPGLTTREIEILRELSAGASNREIANRLYIAENTVKNHIHNILEKLSLSSRREAVVFAKKFGITH
jgi:DNA-binding NarL/FixJ family response regulator